MTNWDGKERRINGEETKQRITRLEILVDSMRELCHEKMKSQSTALNLARDSMDKRLEGMNEFRAQLKEQAGHFITRIEHDALIFKYDEEIKQLNKAKDILEGKASQWSVNVAQIMAAASLVASMLGVIHSFIK